MSLLSKINFKDFHHRIKLGSHKETIPLFFVNCLGSLFPIFITILILKSKGKGIELSMFYSSGEFYLYSAAFLTSSGYIFYNYKERNYDIYSICCLFSSIVIVIDAILYAQLISEKAAEPNFLRLTSLWFLVFSLLAFYLSNYLNIKNLDPNKAESKAVSDIKNQLPNYE